MSNCGSIINITSIGSFLSFPDNPGYISSKGGLRSLTKALQRTCHKRNKSYCYCAWLYPTVMTENSFSDSVLNKQRIDRMMIKRWGG